MGIASFVFIDGKASDFVPVISNLPPQIGVVPMTVGNTVAKIIALLGK